MEISQHLSLGSLLFSQFGGNGVLAWSLTSICDAKYPEHSEQFCTTKPHPAQNAASIPLEKQRLSSVLLLLSLPLTNFLFLFISRHSASCLISRLNGHSTVIKLPLPFRSNWEKAKVHY